MDQNSEVKERTYQVPIDNPQIEPEINEVTSSLKERKFFALLHMLRKNKDTDSYPSLVNFDLHQFNERHKGWKGNIGKKQIPLVDPRLGVFVYPYAKLPESELGMF